MEKEGDYGGCDCTGGGGGSVNGGIRLVVKLCLLVNECQSTILQHNFFFEELCSGRTLECNS